MTDKAETTASPLESRERTRDYWRSELLAMAMSHCHLLGLCGYRETQVTKLPPSLQAPLLGKVRELLDAACHAEANGESRIPITHRVNADLWKYLKPHEVRRPFVAGHPPLE